MSGTLRGTGFQFGWGSGNESSLFSSKVGGRMEDMRCPLKDALTLKNKCVWLKLNFMTLTSMMEIDL